jgi:hypothetical protein
MQSASRLASAKRFRLHIVKWKHAAMMPMYDLMGYYDAAQSKAYCHNANVF